MTNLADALTPKQRIWAEHYAATGNGTAAARTAGYKGSETVLAATAVDNLRKPKVAAYLATLTEPARENRIASAEERQEFLTAVIRGEVKDIATGGKDLDYIETPTPVAERVKAAELLAKMRGDLAPVKLDITARVQVHAQVWVGQVLGIIEQEAGTAAAQRILSRLPVLELEK